MFLFSIHSFKGSGIIPNNSSSLLGREINSSII
nr:MAG TPA: hypothetical protein [Caudoviricetes sp.]